MGDTDASSAISAQAVSTFRQDGFARLGRLVEPDELKSLQCIAIAEEQLGSDGLVGQRADADPAAPVPGSHRLGPLGRLDLIGREHSIDDLSDPTTSPWSASP